MIQIKQFPLEIMHLNHGGVVLKNTRLIFGIERPHEKSGVDDDDGETERRVKYKSKVKPELATPILECWGRCSPKDFERRVRPIKYVTKWKMVEGRTYLLYVCLPMFDRLGLQGTPEYDLMKNLVYGTRLLSGSSKDPIPQVKHVTAVLNRGVCKRRV